VSRSLGDSEHIAHGVLDDVFGGSEHIARDELGDVHDVPCGWPGSLGREALKRRLQGNFLKYLPWLHWFISAKFYVKK